ncbi:MAG: Gldg family protein [Bacteroidota bacterium]
MKLTHTIVNTRALLFIGIFILINLLVYSYYFRLDFTADKRYTLSNTTRNILEELEDPVTVTAHFSENLPASVGTIRRDFQDMLYEYQSRSDRNVVFEFINPNEDEAAEQRSQQQGISPLLLQVRERDKSEQMRAYMGAVVKLGSQQEVIPFVGDGAQMEYNLSRSIKKLAAKEKPKVGFVQGHGEPGLQQMGQIVQELSTLYEVDTVSLSKPGGWSEFKTLVVVAPSDSFRAEHLAELELFLSSGGRLFLGVNRVGKQMGQQQFMAEYTTGLEAWLGDKGVVMPPTFLIDAQCGQVGIPQQTAFGVLQRAIEFPYMPLITNYEEHPVTQGLEAVNMVFVSPVQVSPKDTTVRSGVLAYTSELTGSQPSPTMIDVQKEWTERDFPEGPQPVAVWLEGKLGGEAETKMIVIGDGDFAVGQGQGGIAPNNLNLLVNAIDWLTDDTGLIELRTRSVESRLIEKQLDDSTRNLVKYGVFLLPLLIVIGVGIFRAQKRKSQRVRWMQEDYS